MITFSNVLKFKHIAITATTTFTAATATTTFAATSNFKRPEAFTTNEYDEVRLRYRHRFHGAMVFVFNEYDGIRLRHRLLGAIYVFSVFSPRWH